MGCLSMIQCKIRAALNGTVDLWETSLSEELRKMCQNAGSILKLDCLRGCPIAIQIVIGVIVKVFVKSIEFFTYKVLYICNLLLPNIK